MDCTDKEKKTKFFLDELGAQEENLVLKFIK